MLSLLYPANPRWWGSVFRLASVPNVSTGALKDLPELLETCGLRGGRKQFGISTGVLGTVVGICAHIGELEDICEVADAGHEGFLGSLAALLTSPGVLGPLSGLGHFHGGLAGGSGAHLNDAVREYRLLDLYPDVALRRTGIQEGANTGGPRFVVHMAPGWTALGTRGDWGRGCGLACGGFGEPIGPPPGGAAMAPTWVIAEHWV